MLKRLPCEEQSYSRSHHAHSPLFAGELEGLEHGLEDVGAGLIEHLNRRPGSEPFSE